jgi:hypothetical protein
MEALSESNILLKSFSFEEDNQGIPEVEVPDIKLDNFDLFIGNNAQGKT